MNLVKIKHAYRVNNYWNFTLPMRNTEIHSKDWFRQDSIKWISHQLESLEDTVVKIIKG